MWTHQKEITVKASWVPVLSDIAFTYESYQGLMLYMNTVVSQFCPSLDGWPTLAFQTPDTGHRELM